VLGDALLDGGEVGAEVELHPAERLLLQAGAPARRLLGLEHQERRDAEPAADLDDLEAARLEELRVPGRDRELVELGALVEHDGAVRGLEAGALLLPPLRERVGLRLGQALLGLQDAGGQRAGPEEPGAVLLRGQTHADRLAGGADRRDAADAVVPEAGQVQDLVVGEHFRPPSIA
jgi:hypothetical protein